MALQFVMERYCDICGLLRISCYHNQVMRRVRYKNIRDRKIQCVLEPVSCLDSTFVL